MTDLVSVLLGCVLVVVVLLVAASCLLRANRLDRLHVRTDAARAALVAALERRAVVARAVARQCDDAWLRSLATRTERVAWADREAAENALSERLAAVDRRRLPAELRAELTDAEQRVMLARRVHNDAVRDTLALRSRRLVRWLRLAGTAPAPRYFEIVDPEPEPDDPGGLVPPRSRTARVLLLDAEGRVLLFKGVIEEGFEDGFPGVDPARPPEPFWFAPGGAVRPGEDTRTAAARELRERTGVVLPAERLVGPVWRAHPDADRRAFPADEEFFVAVWRGQGGELPPAKLSDVPFGPSVGPVVGTLGYRWWTDEELRGTDAAICPRQLGELVGRIRLESWDQPAARAGEQSNGHVDAGAPGGSAARMLPRATGSAQASSQMLAADRPADDLHLTESSDRREVDKEG